MSYAHASQPQTTYELADAESRNRGRPYGEAMRIARGMGGYRVGVEVEASRLRVSSFVCALNHFYVLTSVRVDRLPKSQAHSSRSSMNLNAEREDMMSRPGSGHGVSPRSQGKRSRTSTAAPSHRRPPTPPYIISISSCEQYTREGVEGQW